MKSLSTKMKAALFTLVFALSASASVFAHCGMCEGDKEHDAKVHSEKVVEAKSETSMTEQFDGMIQRYEANATTIDEAAGLLKESHPELASKLKTLAGEQREIVSAKETWRAKHSQWAAEVKE